MKRIVLALPVAAAVVFFCLPVEAFDAVAAQVTKVLPEPPDAIQVHWSLPLLGVLIAAFRTAFSNDTVKLPTKAAGWRSTMVVILTVFGTFVEQLVGGYNLKAAFFTLLMLGLPSIAQEILKKLAGASKASGGGGSGEAIFDAPPTSTSLRPPPGVYSTKLAATIAVHENGRPYWYRPAAAGMALGFCLLVSGCAWFKSSGCQVLRVAADLCDDIVIILPDGTEERVPKRDVEGLVKQTRAARIAGAARAADAGADQ